MSPNTHGDCVLLYSPVRSASRHWLNVFFLCFYGAKMFLFLSSEPFAVPVLLVKIREAEVSFSCQLIFFFLQPLLDTWPNTAAQRLWQVCAFCVVIDWTTGVGLCLITYPMCCIYIESFVKNHWSGWTWKRWKETSQHVEFSHLWCSWLQ